MVRNPYYISKFKSVATGYWY